MDDLLEAMAMEQRGGKRPSSSLLAAEEDDEGSSSSSEETEEEDEEDLQPPTPPSPSLYSIWRPNVKPPKEVEKWLKKKKKKKKTNEPYLVPPPPSALHLEVLRHNAIGQLTCFFLNKVNRSMKMELRIPPFERWLFSQHRADLSDDPILPDPRLEEEHAQAGRALLRRELQENGAGKKDAHIVVDQLGKMSIKLLGQMSRAMATTSSVVPTVTVNYVKDARLSPPIQVHLDVGNSQYQLQHKATILGINKAHYDKLWSLFTKFGLQRGEEEKVKKGKAAAPLTTTTTVSAAAAAATQKDLVEKKHFHFRVFLLLLRYSSLAGGTARGGGMQGAINGEAFDVLLRHFDCRMECFASPLNCRFSRYCSAFQDTDACFGSLGSFFQFSPREGMYEANPPFIPLMIDRMARHMDTLLQETTKPLGFIVVIPTWREAGEEEGKVAAGGGKGGEGSENKQERGIKIAFKDKRKEKNEKKGSPHGHGHGHSQSKGEGRGKGKGSGSDTKQKAIQRASEASWRLLHESPFCARHVLLKAQDHGYVEGGQHKLPTRFKTSFFDTSVFFLQNNAAQEKWPVTEEAVRELRSACASKHEEEIQMRRGGPKEGKGKEAEEEEAAEAAMTTTKLVEEQQEREEDEASQPEPEPEPEASFPLAGKRKHKKEMMANDPTQPKKKKRQKKKKRKERESISTTTSCK